MRGRGIAGWLAGCLLRLLLLLPAWILVHVCRLLVGRIRVEAQDPGGGA